MLILKAKIRKEIGKKVKKLRKQDILPAVLYGPKIKNISLELDSKDFQKIYGQAGESSLISLEVGKEKFLVLIHKIEKDHLSGAVIHIDFYQPVLDKEIEVSIPIVLEGQAPAIKELGGTLVREISEVMVRALPQNLPREIKVDITGLKTFDDEILIRDLKIPEGVKIHRQPEEIVVLVVPPSKVEEELKKPIEEKVEDVKKVEEKKEKKEGKEEKTEEAEIKKEK